MGISPIEETTEMRAVGFIVTLNGLTGGNLSLALQSIRQGLPGSLYLALFDSVTEAMVLDPYCVRRGRCDIASVKDDGKNTVIELRYEDRLIELRKGRDRRYADQDQRIDFPFDRGFENVEKLQDVNLNWGR